MLAAVPSGFDERSKNVPNFLTFLHQRSRYLWRQIADILCYFNLRQKFGQGALGDKKRSGGLFITFPLISLGDVARDAYS